MGFLLKCILVYAYFYSSASFIDRKVDLPKILSKWVRACAEPGEVEAGWVQSLPILAIFT